MLPSLLALHLVLSPQAAAPLPGGSPVLHFRWLTENAGNCIAAAWLKLPARVPFPRCSPDDSISIYPTRSNRSSFVSAANVLASLEKVASFGNS